MMYSKIHLATVTEANLNYIGSVTVDEELLQATGMIENERVQVVNVNTGDRLETYIIVGEKGSGVICLNGAAARLVQQGDKVIIIAYKGVEENELVDFKPRIVFVDGKNRITKVLIKEKANTISGESD